MTPVPVDVMTENLVESLIDGICLYHLDTDGLESVIFYNLDEPFVAHNDAGQMDTESAEQTYGSAEHVQILRMMWALFNIPTTQEIDPHRVQAIDARVQTASHGPLFFNLLLTLYSYWSEKWTAENADLEEGSAANEDAAAAGVPYAEAFQAMQGTDIRCPLKTRMHTQRRCPLKTHIRELLHELCLSSENTLREPAPCHAASTTSLSHTHV